AAGPPGLPTAHPSHPSMAQAPLSPRTSSPGGAGLASAEQARPSAPSYDDIDDDDSDEDIRTVLMDAEEGGLSAAIEEALAAKALRQSQAGPPPGWPPGPRAPPASPSEDDESMAPTAAFDASQLPPGMMPDPLGGP